MKGPGRSNDGRTDGRMHSHTPSTQQSNPQQVVAPPPPAPRHAALRPAVPPLLPTPGLGGAGGETRASLPPLGAGVPAALPRHGRGGRGAAGFCRGPGKGGNEGVVRVCLRVVPPLSVWLVRDDCHTHIYISISIINTVPRRQIRGGPKPGPQPPPVLARGWGAHWRLPLRRSDGSAEKMMMMIGGLIFEAEMVDFTHGLYIY